MGAEENLAVVQQLQEAARDRDYDRYGELLADDAVFRMAGVPRGLGGVVQGREAIVENLRNASGGGNFDARQSFADDENVCVVGKITADRFVGNEFLRSSDLPFSTYECIVYRIADGRVSESTAYVNWLDAYTQTGLIDVSSLTP